MKNSGKKTSVVILLVLQAGLIGVSYFLFHQNNFGKIFTNYFNVSDQLFSLPGTRGENNISDQLNEIKALYDQKDYAAVISKINSYIKENPEFGQLKFYRGLAYLESNEPKKAVRDFEDVIMNGQEFVEDAQWFLALAYLKSDNQDKAFEYFSQIAAKDGKYSQQAKNLLNDMDEEPAMSDVKIYQITQNGQYEFFIPSEPNTVRHPVTERTFYLETVRQGVIPPSVSYFDFVKLTVPEKQDLINNAQAEALAALDQPKRDLYEEIRNSTTFPEWSIQVPEQSIAEVPSEERLVEETIANLDEAGVNTLETQQDLSIAGNEPQPERYSIPINNGEQKLPWIVDAMLRAKEGKNLPEEFEYVGKKKTEDVSWVVKSITLQNF